MALERLKSCRNASELAAELGIHRTQLYKWRDQMEPVDDGKDHQQTHANGNCGRKSVN